MIALGRPGPLNGGNRGVNRRILSEYSGMNSLTRDLERRARNEHGTNVWQRTRTPEEITDFDHPPETNVMSTSESTLAQQIAEAVSSFQTRSTGRMPTAVTVVLSEDTLVVTLHDALTPAEKELAKSADGAAKLQELHRQLFASSSESLRQEIKRITGRQVREAAAEFEPTTGSIVHAFTTGTMVQVFLLKPKTPAQI